jgi:hypothetical protein
MTSNIKDYSTTQSNNTSLNGISTAEGMLPSNLNNAIRALMKNTRDWFNDAQWIEYGDGDGASYCILCFILHLLKLIGANVTSIYHAGRRVKVNSMQHLVLSLVQSHQFIIFYLIQQLMLLLIVVHYQMKLYLMFILQLFQKQIILFQHQL